MTSWGKLVGGKFCEHRFCFFLEGWFRKNNVVPSMNFGEKFMSLTSVKSLLKYLEVNKNHHFVIG